MDASAIQDFYRDTLLDPGVMDVSAGIVFASAKDPKYSSITMPGKSTAIIFSEAKDEDFLNLLDDEDKSSTFARGIYEGHHKHSAKYDEAKALVEEKDDALIDTKLPTPGAIH